MSSFKVSTNAKAVRAALQRVPRTMRGAVLARAVVAGGEYIEEGAELLAPRRSGRLASEINTRLASQSSVSAEAEVTYRRGRASRTPAFYGLFAEKGTKNRVRKSGGSTGRMPASPFLVPSFDARHQRAQELARAVLLAELTKLTR